MEQGGQPLLSIEDQPFDLGPGWRCGALDRSLLEPDVAAANTNYLQYANPNKASAAYIDAALLDDPGLYPPAEVLARLEVLEPMTANVESELTRIWATLPKSDP